MTKKPIFALPFRCFSAVKKTVIVNLKWPHLLIFWSFFSPLTRLQQSHQGSPSPEDRISSHLFAAFFQLPAKLPAFSFFLPPVPDPAAPALLRLVALSEHFQASSSPLVPAWGGGKQCVPYGMGEAHFAEVGSSGFCLVVAACSCSVSDAFPWRQGKGLFLFCSLIHQAKS